MPTKILGFILSHLFGFIFKTSQETAKSAGSDLVHIFKVIASIGGRQIKEFIAVIPLFIEFFIHLLKERERLEKKRQLLMLGAATAFTTLISILIVSVLGSWTVQFTLLLAFPLLGVPLFFASGLAITTVVVLFIWLVIFVLNKALSDDPGYQEILKFYLPAEAANILLEIDKTVNEQLNDTGNVQQDSPDLQVLYKEIEKGLSHQGEKTNGSKVIRRLEKVGEKLAKGNRRMERFQEIPDNIRIVPVPEEPQPLRR